MGLMAVEKAQKTNEGQTFLVPRARCLYWIKIKEKGAFYESFAEMTLLHKDSFINVEFLGSGFFSYSNILIFLAPCNAYLYYHPKERILNFSSRIMLCTRKKAGSHGYGHNNILDVNKNAFHKYLWIEVVYVFKKDGEIGDDTIRIVHNKGKIVQYQDTCSLSRTEQVWNFSAAKFTLV